MKAKKIFFVGKVQGVYFRVTCKEKAKQLGLQGQVRNLANGSVEVVATGDDALIQRLIDQLVETYKLSSNNYFTEVIETDEQFSDFVIAY